MSSRLGASKPRSANSASAALTSASRVACIDSVRGFGAFFLRGTPLTYAVVCGNQAYERVCEGSCEMDDLASKTTRELGAIYEAGTVPDSLVALDGDLIGRML